MQRFVAKETVLRLSDSAVRKRRSFRRSFRRAERSRDPGNFVGSPLLSSGI